MARRAAGAAGMMRDPHPGRRDMAKGNPLQEQLLKAGLVKKSKVAAVAPGLLGPRAFGGALRLARGDRAIEAARRAQVRTVELAAQARQIITDKKVPRTGDSAYRFPADGAIRTLLIDEPLRRQLASGALVIARLDDGYELLPRAAAAKVRERDASLIVLDHGQADAAPAVADAAEDAYYAQFVVPDDLVW